MRPEPVTQARLHGSSMHRDAGDPEFDTHAAPTPGEHVIEGQSTKKTNRKTSLLSRTRLPLFL